MLTDSAILTIRRRLLAWGASHFRDFPWRDLGLEWHGLIAEVLLQRTRVSSVVPVYAAFIARFPTPDDLAAAPLEEIEALIFPLGLRWRAPLLKQLGQQLAETDGVVPRQIEELLALAGVGPYAAAAWLSLHGQRRSVIIDANVVRWIGRLVDQPVDGETRRKQWMIDLAARLTPRTRFREYNYAVLDFTMTICVRQPKCAECPIGPKLCRYGRRVLEGD